MGRKGVFIAGCLWALSAAVVAIAPVVAEAQDRLALRLPVPHAVPAALPAILGERDRDLYRRIFVLQAAGKLTAADTLIGKLTDRLLVGHVQAQRYLHPTAYRSKFRELKAWMAEYADHPDSQRIHKLAVKRRPRRAGYPARPTYAVPGYAPSSGLIGPGVTGGGPRRGLSAEDKKKAKRAIRRVHLLLRKGATKSAKEMLHDKEVRRLLSPTAFDRAQARLAAGYFVDGHDAWALDWATRAARSARWVPEATWTAGLAAWRLERFGDAATHFGSLAGRDNVSPWLVSGAAFWAARSHLKDRRPEQVSRWLRVAAGQGRTFYALLARRLLGMPLGLRWSRQEEDRRWPRTVAATAAGKRALALVEVGQRNRAGRELLGLSSGATGDTARGVLILAGQAGLASIALRLDPILNARGADYDGAAFPVPPWRPDEGFRIDRALIYSFIRQESQFNPDARSPAGARGLMQIMPATASWVARDRSLRGAERQRLHDPMLNLELGQRYIEMLLAEKSVGGDLFRMVVAWNAGPGNLQKWLRQNRFRDDPLLFIETITRRETRAFAERVLTNFWIYRDRLGQPTPSLDAVAAGRWPAYMSLDPESVQVAEDVRDRR